MNKTYKPNRVAHSVEDLLQNKWKMTTCFFFKDNHSSVVVNIIFYVYTNIFSKSSVRSLIKFHGGLLYFGKDVYNT